MAPSACGGHVEIIHTLMKQALRTLLQAAGLMLTLVVTVPPVSAEDPPQPSAVIDLLQSAKKSTDPVPLLQNARKQLKNAAGIKGSIRLEAQQLIKEAITEAQTGDKKKVEPKINAAIAKIHKGVGKA